MAFVYEEIGKNDEKVWKSLNLKDWFGNPYGSYQKNYWAVNREDKIYLVHIGGYIDMPDFYDLSYDGRIVRIEVAGGGKGNIKTGATFNWKIMRIYIPKSIWDKREDIIMQISEAFSVVRNRIPIEKVLGINVEILCEPECVEVDYNRR